jgi:hypothetical protein
MFTSRPKFWKKEKYQYVVLLIDTMVWIPRKNWTATVNKNYLAFKSFDFERTWWRLFKKRDVVLNRY